jgi:hypothetical protein
MQYVEEIGSRLLHGRSRNGLSSINFALAPWPILLMTAKPSPHSSIWDVRSTPMSRHRQLDRLRPKSAMNRHSPLFNHLVSAQQQRWRYLQSERLRGLQIDDELEFGRLIKGHVSRISAFEKFRLPCWRFGESHHHCQRSRPSVRRVRRIRGTDSL